MDHATHTPPNGSAGHEQKEVNPMLIVWSAVGLAIGTVLSCLIVWGVFNYFKASFEKEYAKIPKPVSAPAPIPPGPLIQEHPAEELKALHAREDHVLGSYAWVDQKDGIVRIPIDRAMDLLLQRGLPVRSATETPAAKPKPQGSTNAAK
jgi:hypothetical protein